MNFFTLLIFAYSSKFNCPEMLDWMYEYGFLREYLTPACAAKFKIISILNFLSFPKIFLSSISPLINLKFFFNLSILNLSFFKLTS